MTLLFDAAKHRYTLGGIVLPSVTGVLKRAGLIDDSHWTDEHRMRGQAVHAACHYFDEGDLDESSLHPVVIPYLGAYKRFRLEYPGTVREIELPVASATYGYAGTLDRVIDDALWDIKTGDASTAGPQTAAYLEALAEMTGERLRRRFVVRLDNDGSYHADPCKDRNDFKVFLAALTITNWKACHV